MPPQQYTQHASSLTSVQQYTQIMQQQQAKALQQGKPSMFKFYPGHSAYKLQHQGSHLSGFGVPGIAGKIFKCKNEQCGKIFHDITSLKKHMLTHGERQFICQICNKKFLDNSKLRRHQLVHTGEKPFKCEICGKLFSLDFNLRTHLRTHTGEKPYVCKYPGCTKRFTQSSNLVAHEKVHLIDKDANSVTAPQKTSPEKIEIQDDEQQQPQEEEEHQEHQNSNS
eukprot:TRINITY_DN10326_c0_g1_i2.p1 TRINITY_DN10326_c0_g1~~TRINITY_DN10326_c0_g1_i2.p1  ORF type:complete len:224 (-),score=19.05 TRINITY_DN10326_c0_g1_i2:49-720(-)